MSSPTVAASWASLQGDADALVRAALAPVAPPSATGAQPPVSLSLQLPCVVLTRVFARLAASSARDALSAASACRAWTSAASEGPVWTRVAVDFDERLTVRRRVWRRGLVCCGSSPQPYSHARVLAARTRASCGCWPATAAPWSGSRS